MILTATGRSATKQDSLFNHQQQQRKKVFRAKYSEACAHEIWSRPCVRRNSRHNSLILLYLLFCSGKDFKVDCGPQSHISEPPKPLEISKDEVQAVILENSSATEVDSTPEREPQLATSSCVPLPSWSRQGYKVGEIDFVSQKHSVNVSRLV